MTTPPPTAPSARVIPQAPGGGASKPEDRRRFNSDELFGRAQEVEISHGDAIYRLRRTALGKLILTK